MRKVSKNKSKSKRFKIILLAVLVVLLGGILTYYFANSQQSNTSSQQEDNPSHNKNSEDSQNKNSETDISEVKPVTDEANTPEGQNQTKQEPQFSDQDGAAVPAAPQSSSATVSFDAFQNDRTVIITSEINKTWNDGTCNLAISSPSKTISKSTSIQAMPNYSTCRGFNISVDELGTGLWKINLTATHQNNTIHTYKELNVK